MPAALVLLLAFFILDLSDIPAGAGADLTDSGSYIPNV
jgi:hypothetical protein